MPYIREVYNMVAQTNMYALFAAMQSDRLIKSFVGSSTIPLQVQESILLKPSAFFRGALKRDTFQEGKEGVIHFPDDDVTSWTVLNYWMINGEVPVHDCKDEDLINAWYLANKYQMAQLQDDLMYELLELDHDGLWLARDFEQMFARKLGGLSPTNLFAELLIVQAKDRADIGVKGSNLDVSGGDNDYAKDFWRRWSR
ncbi:hypothetical protein DOTSEDRAFT_22794 [Dothistroma septosporum NZE10]|uniref:BTB domain-containing protein n=1 Tax=Dothistroma septosporum (strain NZE10 / CBS 128990) TaxID=675120 RepID=N1PUY5_DOTSN|nr:hypothetical protein DOTSEDRAFT_22794 [Dothistroma septosporum NZE10]